MHGLRFRWEVVRDGIERSFTLNQHHLHAHVHVSGKIDSPIPQVRLEDT